MEPTPLESTVRRLALLLPLLLTLPLAACGERDGLVAQSPSPTASAAARPSPTSVDPQEPTSTVTAWYVRATPEAMWVEPVPVTGARTKAVARAAMQALVLIEPDNPDLGTMAPEGTQVLGVDIDQDSGVLTVDLSEEVDPEGIGFGSAQEVAFSQQLAHTAAQFEGVESVRLLVEGEAITDLWGHVDWSEPVEPDLFALTPVTIEQPRWNWRREGLGPVTASGQANTFEATLAVRLVDPDGEVVSEEWITATSGSGTRGTWEHTFQQVERRGVWTIEAEEPDPSGGQEGRPPLVVRTQFRIT